jgi:HEPN domain-containing protein
MSISRSTAARRLVADPPNRFAAFHLQQASEKLVKAVRLSRGLRVTADHDLEALVADLPPDDPWRAKLRVLEPLSAYATTYRYPSPMGKRKGGPSNDEVVVWIKAIAGLNLEARAALLRQAPPPAR